MPDAINDPIQSIRESVDTIEYYCHGLDKLLENLEKTTRELQTQSAQLRQTTDSTIRQMEEQSRSAKAAFEGLQDLLVRQEQEYERSLRRLLDAFETALQKQLGELARIGGRFSEMCAEHVRKAEAAADSASQDLASTLQSIDDAYSQSLQRAQTSFEKTLMRMNEELETKHRQLLQEAEQRLDALLNEASAQLQSSRMAEALEAGLSKGFERLRQEVIEEVRRPWWKRHRKQ